MNYYKLIRILQEETSALGDIEVLVLPAGASFMNPRQEYECNCYNSDGSFEGLVKITVGQTTDTSN